MLDYVEVRSSATRELLGIIDNAKSTLWSPAYYGTGDFEVYVPAAQGAVDLLQPGNYVTRPDDPNVGIIERVEITYDATDGRMVIAAGRLAKSILDRRLIYQISGTSVSPTIMSGSVEDAVRSLVTKNAINCPFDSERNFAELELGQHSGTTEVIVDDAGDDAEKQATYKGLLEYTDGLLEEYGLGAHVVLSESGMLQYVVYKGVDRSVDNTAGNEPVIFSQNFDNLISSNYMRSEELLKNTALVGGSGEGLSRFCVVVKDSGKTGINRREVFVDASSSSRAYSDDSGTEQTLTDAQYSQQLKTQGQQTLSGLAIVETFSGDVDISQSMVKYGYDKDFYVGDMATIQDVDIGLYINARVLKVIERQDDEGYNVQVEFGL